MKYPILVSLFSFLFLLSYGQKNVKIEVAGFKNYAPKFNESGFSVGIPLEFQKNRHSLSIALQYARKHNLTEQLEPIKEYEIPNSPSCFVCFPPIKHFVKSARQFKFDYLQIPLEYKRYFNHKKEFFFKIGAYAAYAISSQVSHFEFENTESYFGGFYTPREVYTSNFFKKASFSRENIKRGDVGYLLGVGFTKGKVDVNVRFEKSFINLNRADGYTLIKNKTLALTFDMPLSVFKKNK